MDQNALELCSVEGYLAPPRPSASSDSCIRASGKQSNFVAKSSFRSLVYACARCPVFGKGPNRHSSPLNGMAGYFPDLPEITAFVTSYEACSPPELY